jgi:hypothetical protein
MIANNAIKTSKTKLEAVSKYIALLKKDRFFVRKYPRSHKNKFLAALGAFKRFHSTDFDISESDEYEQKYNQPDKTNDILYSFTNIVNLEEGKAEIREILNVHFQTLYGYSNINILWNAAQDNLPLFLNDNAINSPDDLWRFVNCTFLDEYTMYNPHIWKEQTNYYKSYIGIIVNLAKQFDGIVTREQINDYFSRIKLPSPVNRTIISRGSLIFYAPDKFILTEAVNLTNQRNLAIKMSLDRLFDCEKVPYIVLRDINVEWFSSLPSLKVGLTWTPLLLQEVLRLRPTIGYRVIFSGIGRQGFGKIGAAIVPSKTEINSFADLVHHTCFEQEKFGIKMLAEDLRKILLDARILEQKELKDRLHKVLRDYRFAFTDENRTIKILER